MTADQKLDVIKGALDAWNAGDWDEALRHGDHDTEIDNSTAMGEWRGVHTGPDEIKRMWAMFVEPWKSVRTEVDEHTDAGDHVITKMNTWFEGRDGIQAVVRGYWCWTFRDEVLVRVVTANELDVALAAAGLDERAIELAPWVRSTDARP